MLQGCVSDYTCVDCMCELFPRVSCTCACVFVLRVVVYAFDVVCCKACVSDYTCV